MVNSPIPPTAKVKVVDAAEHKRRIQSAMINSFTWECCVNCDHWIDRDTICGKYNALPPIRTIITGCVEWECAIPF
jgi:hypothetical protein